MTSIAKQNTIEALNIYHKAQTNKWEVRVSESGNVRIASWTDRFKSGFRAIFNPRRERTNWNEKVKEAITSKLTKEITSLQKEADKDAIKDLFNRLLTNITKLTDVEEILFQEDETLCSDKVVKKEENIKSAKANYLERENFFEKVIPEDSLEEISLDTPETSYIESTVTDKTKDDLVKLWEIKDNKTYGLVIQELSDSKDKDLRKATNVAEAAIFLIKNYSLPQSVALNAARNCCLAMENKYVDNLNDALDLVKFSGELVREKKIEKTSESIELAYYTKKFITEKNLPINDAVLCAKSLNGIKAEKKIITPAAVEIAVTRLNKMKEFQKVTPRGLPLNIDGSATEFNLKFSAKGEQSIINLLKKPDLEKTDSNGVNSAFTRDANRIVYEFENKNGKNFLDFKSYTKSNNQENKQLNQTDIDKQVELDKRDYQLEVIKQLKKFSNNDEEIYYALSLLCDQGVGISFTRVFTTDFNPENDTLPPDTHIDVIPFQYIGIHPDLPANNPGWAKSKPDLAAQYPDIVEANKNDLTTNSVLKIQWMKDEKIRVDFQTKQKINYISDNNRETFMPLKNSAGDYEIEAEYTVEYKIDTLRKMTLQAKEKLKNNPSNIELKQVTLNPDVDFISSKVFMRINPDWESKRKEF
jgi:hypothetical protein